MRKRNHFVWRMLFAFLLCLAATGRSVRADEIYTLQWVSASDVHFLLIRIAFKGGQSRLFILDTGCPETVIDRQVAAELHLPLVTVTQQATKETSEFTVSPVSFGSGSLSLPELHFGLMDLSIMRRSHPDVAGIIGMDFLAKYSLRMDYSTKQLELLPGHVKGTPNEPPSAAQLPLIPSEGVYNLAGKLDRVKINFCLDTGAEHTFVSEPKVLQSLKPKTILGEYKVIGLANSGLETKVMGAHLMRLEELTLGKLTFKSPVLQRGGLDHDSSGVGNDLLQRFQVVIDFPANVLYLTPDPAYKKRQVEGICTIPFETVPGTPIPLVSISLDGRKPHLYLVDPGTPNSFLDQGFVKSEHLTIQKIKTEANTDIDAILPDRLVIQAPVPFNMEKVPFVVGDSGSLREQAGTDVVGVLGANFLRVFLEKIDFSKKTITFFARDYFAPLVTQTPPVPLQQEEDGYYLKAKLDGNPARFGLYFRYPTTLLQEAPLLSALKPVAKTQEFIADGSVGTENLRLQSLSVGAVTWSRPIIDHNVDPVDSENALGMDFFARFHVTLDLSAKELYLEPDPNYREDSTTGSGTGFQAQLGPRGSLNVVSITVPSPASEAGLKTGDQILEIDGLPIATTPLATIFASRERAAGTPIKLKIRRKGEDKPREFTLQSRKLL